MIKIDPVYIQRVQQAQSPADLFDLVQKAIELEHSTIPPYLTAMFSIQPNTNQAVWDIIHSVVIEEMLHMTIAANLLNALGGQPQINGSGFVPEYPSGLVMGIGGDLRVGLTAYTPEVVKATFMGIEEPENPLVFPMMKASLLAQGEATEEYGTIGQFYAALQQKIDEVIPGGPTTKMPGDPGRQVTSSYFSDQELFPILTKQAAMNAINIIVEQGEGTSTSPVDQGQELAHYYRFEELYRGRQLVKNPSAPNGYSFSGPAIPFNPAEVYPLFPNTKTSMLAAGSEERQRMDEFNGSYYSLLNGLHVTFNGQPDKLGSTIGVMYDIKLRAQKLCAMPFPGLTGYTIGPSFEYVASPAVS